MVWLILSVLLWGLFHSTLASHDAKSLAERLFGARERRYYRLAYNLFACLSFLPVLVIAYLTPDRILYQVALPWSVLMILGMLLALVALVVGFKQTGAWAFLGLRQLIESESARPATTRLTTTGLYRSVRHPLYTAGIVFIWLMPLMTVNVLAINLALTIYVIVGAHFEERKLLREFGAEFAAYQATTPMFIPGLRLRRNKK
jgi:protein-S-isoprenylcysteine O-methyltransferase Ste14